MSRILLNESATDANSAGVHFMKNKMRRGTTFVMFPPGLIEMFLPSGPYGSQEKTLLIRALPNEDATERVAQATASTGMALIVTPELVATNSQLVKDANEIRLRIQGNSQQSPSLLQNPNIARVPSDRRN